MANKRPPRGAPKAAATPAAAPHATKSRFSRSFLKFEFSKFNGFLRKLLNQQHSTCKLCYIWSLLVKKWPCLVIIQHQLQRESILNLAVILIVEIPVPK